MVAVNVEMVFTESVEPEMALPFHRRVCSVQPAKPTHSAGLSGENLPCLGEPASRSSVAGSFVCLHVWILSATTRWVLVRCH